MPGGQGEGRALGSRKKIKSLRFTGILFISKASSVSYIGIFEIEGNAADGQKTKKIGMFISFRDPKAGSYGVDTTRRCFGCMLGATELALTELVLPLRRLKILCLPGIFAP